MGQGGAGTQHFGGLTVAPTTAVPPGWDTHVHVFDASAQVQPGHYQPADHPLSAIEALAQAHGVGHLVLVQPSVYGTDNRVLCAALSETPGRHRGVAVVDASVTDAELDHLHAVGVRGVRFNLVSPVGNPAADLLPLAPRLQARGWHVQWYAHPAHLPAIAHVHQQTDLVCVLDHLAGMHAALPDTDPAWDTLAQLAAQGAWVKLSGWYRLQAQAPYASLVPHIQHVAALFEQRMVWGSDWPHTFFAPGQAPAYADTQAPVAQALGAGALARISLAGAALYG